MLLYGLLTWACWHLAVAPAVEKSGRYGWLTSINVETHGVAFALLFGAIAIYMVYQLGLAIWRLFVDQPAVALDERSVRFHRSFARAPDAIPYEDIQQIIFARADRLPTTTSQSFAAGLPGADSARFGMRCRSGLRIYYRMRHKDKYVTITDNLVEGGEKALLQLDASLRQAMRKQGLRIERR